MSTPEDRHFISFGTCDLTDWPFEERPFRCEWVTIYKTFPDPKNRNAPLITIEHPIGAKLKVPDDDRYTVECTTYETPVPREYLTVRVDNRCKIYSTNTQTLIQIDENEKDDVYISIGGCPLE